MPPWNQSTPEDAGAGLGGVLLARSVERVKLVPPLVDVYTPRPGAPGGVRRPPLTAEEPWRATAVPITIVFGAPFLIAIAPIERLVAAAAEPGTSVQAWPPSVDLNRPRPASESPEPFGSPEPAYTVLPLASLGSTTIEQKELVGRSSAGAIHAGAAASASFVRQ